MSTRKQTTERAVAHELGSKYMFEPRQPAHGLYRSAVEILMQVKLWSDVYTTLLLVARPRCCQVVDKFGKMKQAHYGMAHKNLRISSVPHLIFIRLLLLVIFPGDTPLRVEHSHLRLLLSAST